MLVTTVVSGTRVSLRVLVGHWRSKGVENSTGGNIFGGDENNGFTLTLDLEFLTEALAIVRRCCHFEEFTYHDLSDLWVGVKQRIVKHLHNESVFI